MGTRPGEGVHLARHDRNDPSSATTPNRQHLELEEYIAAERLDLSVIGQWSCRPPTSGDDTPKERIMRRTLTAAAIVAALTAIPVSTTFATTPPDDPNDVTQVDNPADDNDSSGFDDWGLLGLLGLAGLAGLKRRNEHVTRVRDDNLASR